jgi:flavodoxin
LIKRVKDLYPRDPSEKKKVCPVVYRKFEDFLELHLALQKYFPELRDKLPQFSMKTAGFFKIGPSKTGKQRFKELNDYIQQLFKMPSHVVQSVVLKKFIQPTQEDLDNYEFSKRISTDISGQKRLR